MTAAEWVSIGHGQSGAGQGARRFHDRDRVGMGSEHEASDPTGGPAVEGNPTRRR